MPALTVCKANSIMLISFSLKKLARESARNYDNLAKYLNVYDNAITHARKQYKYQTLISRDVYDIYTYI